MQFTDTSTYDGGAPYAYGWNFNYNGKCNPAISTDQNPQTTFTQSGNYPVTLTIGDDTGLPFCFKEKTVKVDSSFNPIWREVAPW